MTDTYSADSQPLRITVSPEDKPDEQAAVAADTPASGTAWPGKPVSGGPAWPGKPVDDKISADPLLPPGRSPAEPPGLETVRKAISPYEREVLGVEPDVDYESGAPWSLRVLMAKMDNAREAKALLSKYYKPDEFGQDKGGRWWVTQNGKKVAVDPSNTSFTAAMENMGVGAQASATPTAGSILGAGIGAMTGPAAPFAIPAGAGIGAAVGKGVDEFQKYLMGVFNKTPEETAGGLMNEATLNTGMAVAPQAWRGFKQAVKTKFYGVTPESSARGERWLERGAIPPVGMVGTEAEGFEFKRKLRNEVSGNPVREQNVAAVEREIRTNFRAAGMSADEIDTAMGEIRNKAVALDPSHAREGVVAAAQRRVAQLEDSINASLQDAKSVLGTQESAVRKWAGHDPGRLADEVGKAVVADRRQFSASMKRAYDNVHALGGEAKVVDTNNAITAAKAIVAQYDLTPGGVPASVRGLANRADQIAAAQEKASALRAEGKAVPKELEILASKDPTSLTIQEAHDLRSQLREDAKMWNLPNMTPDSSYAMLARVEDQVDDAITDVANRGVLGSEAARELRRVDGAYREGIAKFKDQLFRKLEKDIRSGMVPDAEAVAALIARPGNIERTKQVLNLMTPDMRERLAQADMRNKLSKASYQDTDGTWKIDGKKFRQILETSRRVDDTLYEKQFMADVRNMSDEVSALQGTLDISVLQNPTAVRESLTLWKMERAAYDQFAKTNPLGALRSGDPKALDSALHTITAPKNTAQTAEAMALLNPQERNAVQIYMLKRMFSEAMEQTPAGTPMIDGSKLAAAMSPYPEKQLDMLLPYGMSADLRQLGKDLEYLFPAGIREDTGGSISAGNVKSAGYLNPFALRKRILWGVSAFITDRPATLKWLADIHRKDPEAAKMILPGIGRWIMNSATTGPGTEKAPPEPGKVPQQ